MCEDNKEYTLKITINILAKKKRDRNEYLCDLRIDGII